MQTNYPTSADRMVNAGWFKDGAIGVRETTDPMTVTDAYNRVLSWDAAVDTAVNGTTFEPVPGLRLVRRTDTNEVIGWGSDGYTPIQNSECRDLLADSLAGIEHSVAAIGTLRRGARTFTAIELADAGTMNVAGDQIKPFLLLANSFDGSAPLRLINTALRPSCTNMLSMALRQGNRIVTIRHTRNASRFMAAMSGAIAGFLTARDEFQDEVQRLIDTTVTPTQAASMFDLFAPRNPEMTQAALTRAENRREAVGDLYRNDPRVGFTGTAWGALQAMSTYLQNDGQFRRTANGPTTRDERKIEWAMAGGERERQALAIIDQVLTPA